MRGDRFARALLARDEELLAYGIIFDSPQHRLARRIVTVDSRIGMIAHHHDFSAPLGFDVRADLRELKRRKKSILQVATDLASKSASVFGEPLERASLSDRKVESGVRFLNASDMQRVALEALAKRHAFDEGNQRLVRMVQDHRDRTVAALRDMLEPYFINGARLPPPLETFTSAESIYVQAADAAAGFARRVYELEGLIGVVRRFDSVTFNGARISEADAAEHMRRWGTR